jgi:hypothetical protein
MIGANDLRERLAYLFDDHDVHMQCYYEPRRVLGQALPSLRKPPLILIAHPLQEGIIVEGIADARRRFPIPVCCSR